MRPIVTDRVAWSVGRFLSLSVTVVSHVKTAEPIDVPFGLRTRVGSRNHVLYKVHMPGRKGQFLKGERADNCKV